MNAEHLLALFSVQRSPVRLGIRIIVASDTSFAGAYYPDTITIHLTERRTDFRIVHVQLSRNPGPAKGESHNA